MVYGRNLPKLLIFFFSICVFFFIDVPSSFPGDTEFAARMAAKKGVREESDVQKRVLNSGKELVEATERDEDITEHLSKLTNDIEALEAEDRGIQQRFKETEEKLKALGYSSILKRHRDAVKEYTAKTKELKGYLDSFRDAKKRKVQRKEIRERVRGILDFLDKNKSVDKPDLKSSDRSLPWRVVEPGDIQLLGDISGLPQVVLPATSTEPPTGNDLSETVDVQITPEIQEVARSLGNHPLNIFRYVYNNYDYTPYYGSMKGSLDTFWEKEGNDYDIASLLIALLRASNIPSRYVRANILLPVEKVQKLTGINDPMAAIQFLSASNIPVAYYISGGRISHVKLEHVYVEAFVPYSNYRGTMEDQLGMVWVPLDPSLKDYTVIQDGIDIAGQMGFNWTTFFDEYISEIRNITPMEFYKAKVNEYVRQNYPGQSVDTLKRVTGIKNMLFDFLPNTLPYNIVEVIDRFPEIPQGLRHSLRFRIPDVLDFPVSLPEVSGRRITLSFEGATPEDQAVIDLYGDIFKTPPYLIKVKPVVRINGSRASEGTAMGTGINAFFIVTYVEPGGKTEDLDHSIVTGSYNALGITTGKVRPEYLSIAEVEASEEAYLPKMLHSLVMKYQEEGNKSSQLLNDTMKMKSKTFFAEALVSTREDLKKIFGSIPLSFELTGFTIDAKDLAASPIPVDGYSERKVIDFAMVSGIEASYQENRVFEDSMFWVSGLSATKGLQILKAMGIPIIELTPPQTYLNPRLPDTVVDDIKNALNRGWKVIVPEDTGGLPAFPYIKYDPRTGSAGFMIATMAGGLSFDIVPIGYEEDLTWIKDLFMENNIKLSYEILDPPSPYLAAMGEGFYVFLKVIAEDQAYGARVVETSPIYVDTDWTHYDNGYWPLYALAPGKHKYNFDGKNLLTFYVADIVVKNESSPSSGESFIAQRNRSGDTVKAFVGADETANVRWTCQDAAPDGIDSGTCNPASGNGETFRFIPNPPLEPGGRTLPLSYEIKATVNVGTMTREITKVIRQDELDELRQEYEDMPERVSQDRTNFDQNAPAYDRLLDPPDVENGRHEWHILRLHDLNQHATDLDNNYTGNLRITAGYRCPRGNARAGGVNSSNHQYGLALDFNQQSSEENYNAFMAAIDRASARVDSYLKGSNGINYYWNGQYVEGVAGPPWPAPQGVTYVQGHVAWQ